MAKKKKTGKKINPFIRVLISAVLIFGMYHSIAMLSLCFFGETAMGVLDSYHSRRDDAKAGQNQSRTISKTYHFFVDGREYNGRALYSGDEAWPSLSKGEIRTENIRYISILPYINKPAQLTDYHKIGDWGVIYYFLRIPLCVFLFLLVNGWLGKRRKRAKKKGRTEKLNIRRDDTMFCVSCGTKLPEDAVFCTNCGAPAQSSTERAENAPAQASAPPRSDIPPQNNTTLVGWSARSNDPEILEAARKNKKFAIGCAWIFMLLFPIGFLLAGLFIDEMPLNEAIIIGVGLGVIMLIINLASIKRMKRPIWEGVVTEKFQKERREHNRDDDNMTYYTEFTVIIRTDAGKKKRIVEKDSGRHMYDYLTVGDRVRYHPVFGTYEKYDKSKDRVIYCNVCCMMNPISNDRCKRCNNLLFK